MSNPQLLSTVTRLIEEGERVLDSNHEARHSRDKIVEPTLMAKWLPGCRNVLRMLGHYAEPCSEPFAESASYYGVWRAQQMPAALRAIREAIEHNLLLDIEDLILADTFSNLLEQAQYLLKEGYFLAAGVLGRAVLEEHLRKWAQQAGCALSQPMPTVSHYAQALYADRQFSVAILKHIESMAAVGNDAAHNRSTLSASDVTRLLRDPREFLVRYSLSASVT